MKIWYTELLFHWYLDLCSFCEHLDCACLLRQFFNYLLHIHVLGFSQTLNSIVYLLNVVDVYPRQQMQYTLLSWQHTTFKYLSASPNPVKMVVLALTDSKCSNMKDAFWHWFGFTVRRPKRLPFNIVCWDCWSNLIYTGAHIMMQVVLGRHLELSGWMKVIGNQNTSGKINIAVKWCQYRCNIGWLLEYVPWPHNHTQ